MDREPTNVRGVGAAIFAAWLMVAPEAAAQERAGAEELFQLGKAAMAREDYGKACPYLEASLAADFALGTLLNLAICHEQVGKIASAWAEYRTLEDKARRATPPQDDRIRFAHDHAEALRARLSRVRVLVSARVRSVPGLLVRIDGATVAPELFDVGVPVDPGKHAVSSSAPDYEAWSTAVDVGGERLELDVTVPPLHRAARGAPAPRMDVAEMERLSGQRSQRIVGFVVGGIGVAALAAGAVFGVIALGADSDARCPAPCYKKTEDGLDNPVLGKAKASYERANTFGWASNVTLLGGALGLAIGAYLVLTSKPRSVAAWVGPGGAVF